MPDITIGLAFFAGFLSFISPCVLPLIPAYITYLGGRVVQYSAQPAAVTTGGTTTVSVQQGRLSTILHALLFIAGFTFVFVIFGLLVNAGTRAISVTSFAVQEWITRIGGLIIIFFGLQLLGVTGWVLNFLTTRVDWQAWGNFGATIHRGLERIKAALYSDTRRQMKPQHDRYGYFGSAIMGLAFAAGWSPCIGPIYGGILTMAINSQLTGDSTNQVAVLLLAYSLGLGVPFLLSALMLEQMRSLIKRFQRQMRIIEYVSGFLLVVIGSLLLTNQFAKLSQIASPIADFSYDVEVCTMAVFEGKLELGKWGECINNKGQYDAPSASVQSVVWTLVPNSMRLR